MDKAAFYDTKPYDRIWFERLQGKYGVELSFLEYKLSPETAILARGSGAVCAFVALCIPEVCELQMNLF